MDSKNTSTNTPPPAPTPPAHIPNQPQATSEPTNGFAIASLVTGLLNMGIVAVILGILGLKKPGGRGLSIAGIILGAIGILIHIALVALFIIGMIAADSATKEVRSGIESYNQEQASEYERQTAGQKDFAAGETADFGDYTISVNEVIRKYVPENQFSRAGEGKELIVVDATVKNKTDKSLSFYIFDLQVKDGDALVRRSFAEAPGKELESTTVVEGGEVSGQLVFEVTADSKDLKLVREATVYNPETYKSEEVIYSLAL